MAQYKAIRPPAGEISDRRVMLFPYMILLDLFYLTKPLICPSPQLDHKKDLTNWDLI